MILEQMEVGPMGVFAYVLGCEVTREGVVIDPGGETDRILEAAERHGLKIAMVVNTHGHADHVAGNGDLLRRTGAKLAIHEKDAPALRGALQQMAGLFFGGGSPAADVRLQDGDRVRMGGETIEVIHTPGHTPGAICLLVRGNLFTGDTLFVGGVGRTDLPGGSWQTLVESVRGRIYTLPEATVIWPGHNYGARPSSTVGIEKRTNDFIPGE